MKREDDPITDDEWLLRRVPRDKFRPDQTPVVRPSAFEPRGQRCRDPDYDGISFYRKSCLSAVEEILATVAAEKRGDIAIVQLQVWQIKQLSLKNRNLSVVRRDDNRVKGHVVIPELNADALNERPLLTPILDAFAKLSSQPANIVRPPHSTG